MTSELRPSKRPSGNDAKHVLHEESGRPRDDGLGPYWRFGLMILSSSVVMYVVMYLNTYSLDHVFWSWTRFFITLMSAATMAVIMLAFMLKMYRNRVVNSVIVLAAVVLFGTGLFLVRTPGLLTGRLCCCGVRGRFWSGSAGSGWCRGSGSGWW